MKRADSIIVVKFSFVLHIHKVLIFIITIIIYEQRDFLKNGSGISVFRNKNPRPGRV